MYDFGTGNTNPETFPTEELVAAAARAIPKITDALNRYTGELGHEGLRRLMAQRERDREGVDIHHDSIALFNGSMQAVTVVAEALMQGHDDSVICEAFTYVGTINAYKRLGLKMIGLPQDRFGMRMDALEAALRRARDEGKPPRFIYTLATYQNPTGTCMPNDRRLELIDIARRFDMPVVEDNCYADVHFEGEKPKAIYALDGDPRHIYMCSLSKIFAPGVRLGYLYAKAPWFQKIVSRRLDAGPNTLAAAITNEYLEGRLWEHCERNNAALKLKRDAMFEALESSLGNVCTWSHPVGGLFLWLRLPDDVDRKRLAVLAEERGVKYALGSAFHCENADEPYIRLAFGYPPETDIRAGIPVLASCILDARVRR